MSRALSLVVCGAPLTARAADVAATFVDDGWDVTVVGTPASRAWLDQEKVSAATGKLPLFDQRDPQQSRRGSPPAHVLACPLTFNSGNKLALGVMDTYAAGVLCEALASKTPLTAVTMISERLWPHPAWEGHVRFLQEAGVRFIDPLTGASEVRPVRSGSGPEIVSRFDPRWLLRAVNAV